MDMEIVPGLRHLVFFSSSSAFGLPLELDLDVVTMVPFIEGRVSSPLSNIIVQNMLVYLEFTKHKVVSGPELSILRPSLAVAHTFRSCLAYYRKKLEKLSVYIVNTGTDSWLTKSKTRA